MTAAGRADDRGSVAALDVTADGVRDGKPIPEKFASCTVGNGKGGNVSPAIDWSKGPAGTQSYAVIVVDPDVPASFEQADKKGRSIPPDAPRRNFYHWVLVDIPAKVTSLPEGAGRDIAFGTSGRNDFGPNGERGGTGYDGPCPPWNDARMHHYHFMVYALDVPTLNLVDFGGRRAENALQGHILAKGEVVGTYTTNPDMKPAG